MSIKAENWQLQLQSLWERICRKFKLKQIFVLTSVDELPTKTADNTILVPIDDTAHVSADDADDDVPVDDTLVVG